LRFEPVKKEEDIIAAINSIFKWINVYKITEYCDVYLKNTQKIRYPAGAGH